MKATRKFLFLAPCLLLLVLAGCVSREGGFTKPAENAAKPVVSGTRPLMPGEAVITTEAVRAYAARLVALDRASGSYAHYDANAVAGLVDSKALTDAYFSALREAFSNVASETPELYDPTLFENFRQAELEWTRWSQDRSNGDIAKLVSLDSTSNPAVPDRVRDAVFEAHMLAFAVEAVDPAAADGVPAAAFEVLPGARVRLLANPVGSDGFPLTYEFARDRDGNWRVVGIEHENLVRNLEQYLTLAD